MPANVLARRNAQFCLHENKLTIQQWDIISHLKNWHRSEAWENTLIGEVEVVDPMAIYSWWIWKQYKFKMDSCQFLQNYIPFTLWPSSPNSREYLKGTLKETT
jgi:hypothetical protein